MLRGGGGDRLHELRLFQINHGVTGNRKYFNLGARSINDVAEDVANRSRNYSVRDVDVDVREHSLKRS